MEDPMAIDKKLIDQLLTDYKKPEDIIGENGLLKELTKAILERALEAEMTDHLGYEKHDPAGHHRGNTRNGKSQKTLKGEFGELELETPRDRQATFDPKIVVAAFGGSRSEQNSNGLRTLAGVLRFGRGAGCRGDAAGSRPLVGGSGRFGYRFD